MKTRILHIWIIDDHPLIVAGYIKALEQLKRQGSLLEFKIFKFYTIDAVLDALAAPLQSAPDMIFLDIKLPPDRHNKYLSGEDLGVVLLQHFPEVLLLVFTSIQQIFRVSNILTSLNPKGFILKSDTDYNSVIDAVSDVLNGIPYYSPTIQRFLRRIVSHQFFIDRLDRKFLFELSRGTRMVRMTEKIPLSMGGLEKRKRSLKILFDVEGGDDQDLLEAARKYGFVD